MNKYFFILLCLIASACSQEQQTTNPLVKRGKSIYQVNCTTCHSTNPTQDGPVGPAVSGSSRELVEARIVRGSYPEGYTPKRTTQVMQALPHLAGEIEALTAYLNSL